LHRKRLRCFFVHTFVGEIDFKSNKSLFTKTFSRNDKRNAISESPQKAGCFGARTSELLPPTGACGCPLPDGGCADETASDDTEGSGPNNGYQPRNGEQDAHKARKPDVGRCDLPHEMGQNQQLKIKKSWQRIKTQRLRYTGE